MNKDDKYKRCVVCNHCNATDGGPYRRFVKDKPTQEWHCSECQRCIQDVVDTPAEGYATAYWLEMTEKVEEGPPIPEGVHLMEDATAAVDPLPSDLNAYLDEGEGWNDE